MSLNNEKFEKLNNELKGWFSSVPQQLRDMKYNIAIRDFDTFNRMYRDFHTQNIVDYDPLKYQNTLHKIMSDQTLLRDIIDKRKTFSDIYSQVI